MKKLVLAFAIALLILAVETNAQNPCADCISPSICSEITVNVPGCNGQPDYQVHAWVCYHCSPSQSPSGADILEISGLLPGCPEDAAWDAVYSELLNDQGNWCGYQDCYTPPFTKRIEVTTCVCMNMHYKNGTYSYTRDLTACGDRRHICVYDMCFCYFPKCNPTEWRVDLVSSDFAGNGDCEFIDWRIDPESYPLNGEWDIPCQHVDVDCWQP